MNTNQKLLIFSITLAALFWEELRMVSDGLSMIVRGLRHREPTTMREGCASVVVGLVVIVATFRIGIPCLYYLLLT
jgi:hypothetical protein